MILTSNVKGSMRLFLIPQCLLSVLLMTIILVSCGPSLKNYHSDKKYSTLELKKDYNLLKDILEKTHPSLYWYTPKDSMDYFFDYYQSKITDSLTENEFAWKVIAPLLNKIKCGHTTVQLSKKGEKRMSKKKYKAFPLGLKFYNDSMVVWGNMFSDDSIFTRGLVIKKIDGMTAGDLTRKMFDYLPRDGEELNLANTLLTYNFPYFHANIIGVKDSFNISYLDTVGMLHNKFIKAFSPDSIARRKTLSKSKLPPKKTSKNVQYRSLEIDSLNRYGVMTLNTFMKGKLPRFFKHSFQKLKNKNINNLIIDLRGNGGGKVKNSTLLSQYISKNRFKICDSMFATIKSLKPYTSYFKATFLNNIELFLMTRKKSDQYFHDVRSENIWYRPKRKNHFNGNVYVLINGTTFSASCIFTNCVKGQEGVHIVGENSGGGWYGNNGMMIPDITLPETKVRVRIPLFRAVQYNHQDINKGKGIVPDVLIAPDYQAIKEGKDSKMEAAIKMILDNLDTN